ncbi:MAG: sulfatase [Deltaproteobacteria bacterium]|nr:MAG: sulfatase [Deltaproteobacteria bacterium]
MHAHRAFATAWLIALSLAVPGIAVAQLNDCEDVDHDCGADPTVSRGIRAGGATLLRCLHAGTDPCDLTNALASIASPECRFAVECELRALLALVGDGSTSCVQQLFREGYKFMGRKVRRIAHDHRERIPDDLTLCKDHGGSRCEDPIAPPLTDACVGNTTPAAGAGCVCDAADAVSNRMLLTPTTCIGPATLATPAPPVVTPQPRVSGSSPNLLIILSDDQRWDTVDAMHESPGRPGPVMPIVTSELVNSGVTFTHGYVTTALCCPSRTSILTGQYSHDTGVHDNSPPDGGAEVFDDSSTLATWLHNAGYRTGFIGKYLNGYASLSPCIPPGYDEWHVQVQVKYYEYDLNDNGVITHFDSQEADYSGDVMTQRAVDFIHSNPATKPFFLHLSQKAPHGPATPAMRHIGLFDGIAPFRPPNYAAVPTNGPAWVQALTWDTRGCDTCPANKKCDACETDKFRQMQLESLQAVDEGVGAIMQALRDIGEDDNTLVVYLGDNGFSWGSHRWKPKQCPYEECMHVPMIMRYPPLVTAPRIDDRFVLNIDLAPTFVELAGAVVPPTHTINGASVVPLLAGGPATWRDDMLNEHWNGQIPTNGLVKQGRCSATTSTICATSADCSGGQACYMWKYIEYVTGESELYNNTTDPYELTNETNNAADATVKAALVTRLHELQAE